MSNAHVHPVMQEALAPFAPPQRQSISLYEIEQEFQDLLDCDETTQEEDAAYVERLQQLVALDNDRIAKRDQCAHVLLNIGYRREAIAAERERLARMDESLAGRERRIKAYLEHVMNALGVRKLEGHISVISLRRNPASLAIDDEARIPPEYIEVRTVVQTHADKARIKAALLAGEQVPGARLITDRQRVEVR
jgi:hypothetical protein